MKQTREFLKRSLPRLAGTIATIIVVLNSCHTESTVDKSVLTDSPCLPPCWQGITPGTDMTEEEIIGILQTLPAAENIEVQPRTWGREVAWRWRHGRDTPPRFNERNFVLLSQGVVQEITLQVQFHLTVQEVLNWHGIPEGTDYSRTLLTKDQEHWVIRLLYPTQGLLFRAAVPWKRREGLMIEPTTFIFEVTYFARAESLDSWLEANPYRKVYPWPGYGEVRLEDS